MTKRRPTKLAELRRANKEARQAAERANEIARAQVTMDIDPSELLKSAKVIIHTEVKRMAEAQARQEPITPNDAKKLSTMIATISQMLTIKEKTKPDLSGMSDEELEALALAPAPSGSPSGATS